MTTLFLVGSYLISGILINHTGGENNSALVYVLAVVFISLLTTGYVYGIVASLLGAFFINYYFMFPYAEFSLSRTGYPVAMLSMLVISCVVCALTARVKQQATEAVRREKSAKALYEMNERLNREKAAIQLQSARETIRGNILRAVSHDLRTPLTAISGAVSVLLSSGEVTEKNRPMLEGIKNDADGMIVMVENLLSVTRFDGGQVAVQKTPTVLDELIDTVLVRFQKRYPKVPVTTYLPDSFIVIPMDSMLISQVLTNLLENAAVHAEGMTQLTLRVFTLGSRAVFEVSDNGCGIPKERLRTLFTGVLPADAAADSGKHGMGIGLSVCAAIVKAHGGEIQAESKVGEGTSIRFWLETESIETEENEDEQ